MLMTTKKKMKTKSKRWILFIRMSECDQHLLQKARDACHFTNMSEWARVALIKEATKIVNMRGETIENTTSP